MPLLVHAIDLPPDVVDVRAADVDGDQVEELVFTSQHHSGRRPDAVTLTVVDVAPSGTASGRRAISLGRTPTLWDTAPGLWALDASGARDLLQADASVVPVSSVLSRLGPSTPRAASILSDIDHDGSPELLAHGGRGLLFVDLATGAVHPLRAEAYGAVSESRRRGGAQVEISVRWPRTEVADVDGDGIDDIIWLRGDHLTVWTGRSGAAPVGPKRIDLPIDIDPYIDPALPPDADRKPVERVWLEDVDGDGKVDLVAHRAVMSGSWLGATAELIVSLGTGTKFSRPALVRTEAAAVDVSLDDIDSDGDLDLVVPQIEITFSNMARALVAKRMQVEVQLFEWDGGLSVQPQALRSVSVPIENSESLHVVSATDLTGDGLADMVYQEGDGPLQVFAGAKNGMSEKPWAEVQVEVPPGEESLFLHDVTGNGTPEIIIWGPGRATGSVVTVQ
ncbi:MAG: hypothetical protein CL927_06290 [Deltaproteobacteria bacterium]|nr:hypothetical protein [Deltaproteobacteria bacterium]HCH63659.1 hypothetical protein [Deltaproteobacteria bacterium]